MGNCTGRLQEGHRPYTTPPPSERLNHGVGTTLADAATMIAALTLAATAADAPALATLTTATPNTAAPTISATTIAAASALVRPAPNNAATATPNPLPLREQAIDRLHRVLKSGDFSKLPTANALKNNLHLIYKSDSTTNKALIYDALTALTNHIPTLLTPPAVRPSIIVRLAEISQVLLRELNANPGQLPAARVQLKLEHLKQLHSLFNEAVPYTEDVLLSTRNSIAIKLADLARAISIANTAPGLLASMNTEFQNNFEVVMAGVNTWGWVLQFASDERKDDQAIVLAAVQSDGGALEFSSPRWRNDKPTVMAAIQKDGFAYQYASENLKDDNDVALAAVSRSGSVLGLTSTRQQANFEIVKAAVQRNGEAVKYASPHLRDNLQIGKLAICQNAFAIDYLGQKLQQHPEIIELVMDRASPSNAEFLKQVFQKQD